MRLLLHLDLHHRLLRLQALLAAPGALPRRSTAGLLRRLAEAGELRLRLQRFVAAFSDNGPVTGALARPASSSGYADTSSGVGNDPVQQAFAAFFFSQQEIEFAYRVALAGAHLQSMRDQRVLVFKVPGQQILRIATETREAMHAEEGVERGRMVIQLQQPVAAGVGGIHGQRCDLALPAFCRCIEQVGRIEQPGQRAHMRILQRRPATMEVLLEGGHA